jgi:uncharacterized protein YjiK
MTNTGTLTALRLKQTSILLWLLFALFSCSGQPEGYKNPPNYNLRTPNIIKLPEELNEVSGIAYYPKDNSIFAESDEKGQLYKIPLRKPMNIKKWKFGHKEDYEDLVLVDSTFYVLNSNGNIVVVSFSGNALNSKQYEFPEKAKQEFEALYYDKKMEKLVLICKDCDEEIKTTSTAYTFDPKLFQYAGAYTIDAARAIAAAGNKSTRLKLSAAAINPVTGDLYMITSVNRALLIANRNGVIKETYPLDPAMFQHPEGITFTPEGNMFISNEADDPKPANILYFQYKNR